MPIARLAPTFALLVAAIVSGACADRDSAPSTVAAPCDTTAVRRLVTDFGDRMKLVSLQSPDTALTTQIEQAYADLVTPELLATWRARAKHGAGRFTVQRVADDYERVYRTAVARRRSSRRGVGTTQAVD